jgi:ribosome-associated toxin RatA of RatAB toxin-antitoxin module
MRTVDRVVVSGSLSRTFQVASDVERWPEFLPHYRWVRMLQRHESGGTVEMAAWRDFGVVRYPTWWVSDMTIVPAEHRVLYRHVKGITNGMDVEWRLTQSGNAVHITIVHDWPGPQWPLIGGPAASLVIGPIFIHAIASRTLAGVKREVEHV